MTRIATLTLFLAAGALTGCAGSSNGQAAGDGAAREGQSLLEDGKCDKEDEDCDKGDWDDKDDWDDKKDDCGDKDDWDWEDKEEEGEWGEEAFLEKCWDLSMYCLDMGVSDGLCIDVLIDCVDGVEGEFEDDLEQ